MTYRLKHASCIFRVLVGLVLLPTTSHGKASAPDKPPQIIVVSFDATPKRKRLEDWPLYRLIKSLKAAAPTGYQGPAPSFTVFYNTAALQLPIYWKPSARLKKRAGHTFHGYRPTHRKFNATAISHRSRPVDIERSVKHLKAIHAEGVELGSHGVGHSRGGKWSYARWRAEFEEFQRVVTLFDLPRPSGFRAPFLHATPHTGLARAKDPLYRVLTEFGMRHDASKVYGMRMRWPHRVGDSEVWTVPVPIYQYGGGSLSLFFASWTRYKGQAFYRAIVKMFRQRYVTERAPLPIGGHGEHPKSIEKFLKQVCYLDTVRCMSHQQLADYMDANPQYNDRKMYVTKSLRKEPYKKTVAWFKAFVESGTAPIEK